jgi:uncharacterized protein (TIGR02145 family)
MKNSLLFLSFVVMSIFAFGQTPQAFKYQAIARDLNGNPVINQEISVKISILAGNPEGEAVYTELHQTTTNSLGLINLEVGRGTAITGNFAMIAWGNNVSFIKTELDLAGGNNFVFMGTSQLLSVPYSLYSQKAKTLNDGTNAGEILYWNGGEWVILTPGSYGQALINCDGILTWGGCLPKIETSEINVISFYLAYGGGNVTNDGGSPVIQRGICWSTSPNPTIEINEGMTINGSGTGIFESTLSNLIAETNYFVRAYAINSNGTTYGMELSFTSLPTYFTCGNVQIDDRDGMQYKTSQIGNQCWMAENLAYLPTVNPGNQSSSDTPFYYVYGYFGSNVVQAKTTQNYQNYGVLYNFPSSLTACPVGWHLPSKDEWLQLIAYVSMNNPNDYGNKAKSCRQVNSPLGGDCNTNEHPRWNSDNTQYGTDDFEFSGLPGGYRHAWSSSFMFIGDYGFWWTATFDSLMVINQGYFLKVNNAYFDTVINSASDSNSVRCVWDYSSSKDQTPTEPIKPSPENSIENQ